MGKNSPITPLIRLLACIITLIPAVLMGTNHEKVKLDNYFYEAKYIYWDAFQFFVITYSIASAWNFLLMCLPDGNPLWRLAVLIEWVITTLMITSCAMTTNTYIEMKTGVAKAGWSPQCCIVPAFCSKVLTSLVFGYISLVLCVPIFVYSIVVLADPFLTD